jgi:hypothetical protein
LAGAALARITGSLRATPSALATNELELDREMEYLVETEEAEARSISEVE